MVHLDDPLDAIAVHAWNGCWGLIAPGFFSAEVLIQVGPVHYGGHLYVSFVGLYIL